MRSRPCLLGRKPSSASKREPQESRLYVVIVNSTYADSSEAVRQYVARRIAEHLRDRHSQYEKVETVRVSFETKSERQVGIATITNTAEHGSYVFPVTILGPRPTRSDTSAQQGRECSFDEEPKPSRRLLLNGDGPNMMASTQRNTTHEVDDLGDEAIRHGKEPLVILIGAGSCHC